MARSKAKEEEKTEETPAAPAVAPAAPPRERSEKQEKHEKQEKQEKHEKREPEKGEKHEKRGMGVWGSVLAGIILIGFGMIIFLANFYNVPSWLWWPVFLVIVGIAVIVYAIAATSMMRRSPAPA